MQGELREIDIRSILQLLEVGQRTGELLVEAYGPSEVSLSSDFWHPGLRVGHGSDRSGSPIRTSWFVFFIQGQIVYASDGSGDVQRLRDYLSRYDLADAVQGLGARMDSASFDSPATPHSPPEYSYLWSLLEQGTLKPPQGRSIVKGMIRETLFDLLGLHQGAFIFEMSPPLSPTLVTVECSALVGHIMQRVQLWKQLHPLIQSPDQCPFIDNHEPLQQSLKPGSYKLLRQWADGHVSIRQISRYLNRDVVSVAKALHPYIGQGIVHLSDVPEISVAKANGHLGTGLVGSDRLPTAYPQERAGTHVPRILCIDDGVVLRQTVEGILQEQGYDAVTLGDPLEALGQVFKLKPDLILCDIAMPELNGYEVCAMLRKSTAFRQVPIVMLTGKDGFIDRVKARMVGANDYLTKPFSGLELLTLVERYVGELTSFRGQAGMEAEFPLADVMSIDE